jgi:hypothetical protein
MCFLPGSWFQKETFCRLIGFLKVVFNRVADVDKKSKAIIVAACKNNNPRR